MCFCFIVPRVLIIHMIRFDDMGQKLSHNIDFPEKFQFEREYMNDDLAKNEQQGWIDQRKQAFQDLLLKSDKAEEEKFKRHQYILNSLIIHKGYRAGSGHYYAIIKVSEKWVKFDDDKITFIDQAEIASYSQKAYLLFYQK